MKASGVSDNHLYRTIAEVLGVALDLLSAESSPDTIPSWDSLNHLNLVMALEGEFGVSLSVEDALAMRTVAEMRTVLQKHGVAV